LIAIGADEFVSWAKLYKERRWAPSWPASPWRGSVQCAVPSPEVQPMLCHLRVPSSRRDVRFY